MIVGLLAENEYSNGFVMAITEFRISGVSGVWLHVVPTANCPLDVVTIVDDVDVRFGDVLMAQPSTPIIGVPLMLPFKLYILCVFFFSQISFLDFWFWFIFYAVYGLRSTL